MGGINFYKDFSNIRYCSIVTLAVTLDNLNQRTGCLSQRHVPIGLKVSFWYVMYLRLIIKDKVKIK